KAQKAGGGLETGQRIERRQAPGHGSLTCEFCSHIPRRIIVCHETWGNAFFSERRSVRHNFKDGEPHGNGEPQSRTSGPLGEVWISIRPAPRLDQPRAPAPRADGPSRSTRAHFQRSWVAKGSDNARRPQVLLEALTAKETKVPRLARPAGQH